MEGIAPCFFGLDDNCFYSLTSPIS